jgi:hypothetical protein
MLHEFGNLSPARMESLHVHSLDVSELRTSEPTCVLDNPARACVCVPQPIGSSEGHDAGGVTQKDGGREAQHILLIPVVSVLTHP